MTSRRVSIRLAACFALAGAAGLVVSTVVLVVRNSLALAGALAALAVATWASWHVLTRRGAARTAWVVVAVAALAAGTYVLLAADALPVLLAIAASSLLLAFGTRRAFAHLPEAPKRARRRERSVLIVNPRSGDGRAERAGLVGEAARRGIETVVLGPADDLYALAEHAVTEADVIGMAGGDGSQALVADVAAAHDVPFVCVPAGTRNHFALDLGIDRHDLIASLDAYDGETHVERRIDLAQVNGRTFVNNVSLGVYAELVRQDGYRAAKLPTAARLLPDLLAGDAPGARLVGLGGRPRLDTGRLGILTLEVANAAAAAKLVSLEAVGAVRTFEGWREWDAPELTLQAPVHVAAAIDGEPVVLEPPLVFGSRPQALRVRLSPSADERRRRREREHAGAANVLESLWAIAVG